MRSDLVNLRLAQQGTSGQIDVMSSPFDDPFRLNSTARQILEQDRQMRQTLKSLKASDHSMLALQAMRQHEQIEAFLRDAGGVEGIREHMARAAAAHRDFAAAFPPDRLKELQAGFAQHAVLASSVGRDLALLAQRDGAAPGVFTRLQFVPNLANVVNHGLAQRQSELSAAIAVASRLDVPWASATLPYVSIGALAELTGFTARVRSAASGDEGRMVEVEQQFGDYDEAFADAETASTEDEREAVYTEGGRNPTLVAFPSRSYPSVLVAAGWVADFIPPPPPLLVTGAVCEFAFHDPADNATIVAVEAHLRHFVDANLTRLFGVGWTKTYVPAEKSALWTMRQQASVNRGNPAFAPIYYADFQDLLDVVGRRDLWRDVFGPVFGSKPLFEATMTRLHAIRLELAHARPLTNTARLRLEVEANTIFTALGVLARD